MNIRWIFRFFDRDGKEVASQDSALIQDLQSWIREHDTDIDFEITMKGKYNKENDNYQIEPGYRFIMTSTLESK